MKTRHIRRKSKPQPHVTEASVHAKKLKETAQKNTFFQPKYKVSDQTSASEKEADKMADHVTQDSARYAKRGNQKMVQRQEESTSAKTSEDKEEPTTKIQRQAEKEEEPATKLIQRQAEKEEEPATKLIQRQAEKEEEPATKIQRQAEKEEEPTTKIIQRQAENEEEPATKLIQRQTEKEEEPATKLIQRQVEKEFTYAKASVDKEEPDHDRTSASGLENMIKETKGLGMALPDDIRSEMEAKFKADFSQVRIHTGPGAEIMTNMLHAQAFTHGYDIYFNDGKFQPHSSSGKHLLAHELAHVIQQKGNGK